VPPQLLGDWFLPPAVVASIEGNVACRLLKLTLTTTTYHLTHTTLGVCGSSSSGDVVVNNTEIDFFNGDGCLNPVPGGVGRYAWMLMDGVLHFTPENQGPCALGVYYLANESYSRTS
jgi:hypothetical protein